MSLESRSEIHASEDDSQLLVKLPNVAWDFPLSKAEKVRRLLLIFEAELECSKEEVKTLSRKCRSDDCVTGSKCCMAALSKPCQESMPASVVTCEAICLHMGCTSACKSAANPLDGASEAAAKTAEAAEATAQPVQTATIRWDDSVGVRWLDFSANDVGAAVANEGAGCRSSPRSSKRNLDCQLVLNRGEYVRLIRGRIDKRDGRLADWVTLVTSRLRSVTLGQQESGTSPMFSFIAASGHEICGIESDEDGVITGILQRPLAACQLHS